MNKEAFEGVIKFLSVMATGNQLPDRLKIDAEHVRLIMTADTAEIAEVSKAALVIDGIKRSQEQNLHFVLVAAVICFFLGRYLIIWSKSITPGVLFDLVVCIIKQTATALNCLN